MPRLSKVDQAGVVECRSICNGRFYKLQVGPRAMVLVEEELRRVTEVIKEVLPKE